MKFDRMPEGLGPAWALPLRFIADGNNIRRHLITSIWTQLRTWPQKVKSAGSPAGDVTSGQRTYIFAIKIG